LEILKDGENLGDSGFEDLLSTWYHTDECNKPFVCNFGAKVCNHMDKFREHVGKHPTNIYFRCLANHIFETYNNIKYLFIFVLKCNNQL